MRLYQRYHGLGASCDGIVVCGCHGERTVEIKCPYKHRDEMLEAVNDKHFHLDTKLKLKRSHEYYSQVQMQLHVLGLKQACFATWTEKDFRYEVIDIEENWMENMDKMVEFHKRWVCRELVTRELEGAPKQKTFARDNTPHCSCRKPWDALNDEGQMVLCDGCNTWFHFKCVGLSSKPNLRAKWYCPKCRK